MTTQTSNDDRIALLQGTLDVLILKTLVLGPCHGQGVARLIQRQSEQVFFVDHGSLYLALQRLEDKKWISATWGVSENNRNREGSVRNKAPLPIAQIRLYLTVRSAWHSVRSEGV